jgi:hypothetical protein
VVFFIQVTHHNPILGRAMAQVVSRRPPTAETRVRSRVSRCGICGGQSGSRTGSLPSNSGFLGQFHSTGAPLHEETKKLIIVITGLHNKPQCCGGSVHPLRGPSPQKLYIDYVRLAHVSHGQPILSSLICHPKNYNRMYS